MKRRSLVLGACAALFTRPMVVFGHGYDTGDAALGGRIGVASAATIFTAIAQAPLVVERSVPAQCGG